MYIIPLHKITKLSVEFHFVISAVSYSILQIINIYHGEKVEYFNVYVDKLLQLLDYINNSRVAAGDFNVHINKTCSLGVILRNTFNEYGFSVINLLHL